MIEKLSCKKETKREIQEGKKHVTRTAWKRTVIF